MPFSLKKLLMCCFPCFRKEQQEVISSLTELRVWHTQAVVGGMMGWILNPVFRENMKTALLGGFVCLFVGYLSSQQHASVSQGRICSVNFTCCHTEIEVADQTFYFTQSQYTDTGLTSPSTDTITPGVWQGSHWITNV